MLELIAVARCDARHDICFPQYYLAGSTNLLHPLAAEDIKEYLLHYIYRDGVPYDGHDRDPTLRLCEGNVGRGWEGNWVCHGVASKNDEGALQYNESPNAKKEC